MDGLTQQPGRGGGVGQQRSVAAQRLADDSPETLFTHDVPAEVLTCIEPSRHQTSTLFEEPWPLDEWPPVATRFLLCRDDRFFPAEWLRSVVREQLRIEPSEVPGGHAAHLSQPRALAEALLGCWAERTVERAGIDAG